MGYKKDIIKGLSWIGSLRFLTKAVGFLEAIILARILAPEQFGAYAVALLALGLLEVLTETGVNIVLVQEKHVDAYISSAWLISIIRGVLIMFLLLASAPFIASFFNVKQALPLLSLVSFVPLLRGFINPSVVKFQKELYFGKDFWYRFVVLLVDTGVSVSVTFITRNPIGIVVGLLAGVFVETFLSYFIVSPRPSFHFNKAYIRKIFHRGKWVTGSTIFDYLFYNADNIVVGRFLGAGSLGIYQLAYSIAVVPLAEIGKVFFHVIVPVMVKISADTDHAYRQAGRLRYVFLRTLIGITAITLPLLVILVFTPQIFVFLLGQKWEAIASILPILGVLGFVKAISLCPVALFTSSNKQEYTMFTMLINSVGLLVTIVPLVAWYGLFGAGASALFGSILAVPFLLYYSLRILKKTAMEHN
jgi:O-antigen/teichoic acid export membrane protein